MLRADPKTTWVEDKDSIQTPTSREDSTKRQGKTEWNDVMAESCAVLIPDSHEHQVSPRHWEQGRRDKSMSYCILNTVDVGLEKSDPRNIALGVCGLELDFDPRC